MNSAPSEIRPAAPGQPLAAVTMEQLRALLVGARENLSPDKPRTYLFIPFTEEELDDGLDYSGETKLSVLAARRAERVDVRQLAISLREARMAQGVENAQATTCSPSELLGWFNGCDRAAQDRALEKAALKVPFVLMYGESNDETLEARRPARGDTVILSAHGSSKMDVVSPGQKSEERFQIQASDVVSRMQENDLIPQDIGTIRLASCGSRDLLFRSFKQACEDQNAYAGANLVSYGFEDDERLSALFSYGSEESNDLALVLHDLDKGLRAVVSKDEDGRELKRVRDEFYKQSARVHASLENVELGYEEDPAYIQVLETKKREAFAAMQRVRDAEQKSSLCKVSDVIGRNKAAPAPQQAPASPGRARPA